MGGGKLFGGESNFQLCRQPDNIKHALLTSFASLIHFKGSAGMVHIILLLTSLMHSAPL